jgi:hypothetical protein
MMVRLWLQTVNKQTNFISAFWMSNNASIAIYMAQSGKALLV